MDACVDVALVIAIVVVVVVAVVVAAVVVVVVVTRGDPLKVEAVGKVVVSGDSKTTSIQ